MNTKRKGRPPLDVSRLSGGHPLAQLIRDEMTARGLSVADVHRLAAGVSRSAVYWVIIGRTGRGGAGDRSARIIAQALGIPVPPAPPPKPSPPRPPKFEKPKPPTPSLTRRDTVPISADTKKYRLDNAAPNVKWLALVVSALDEDYALGTDDDVRKELEGATRSAIWGLQELLTSMGSRMVVTVRRPKS